MSFTAAAAKENPQIHKASVKSQLRLLAHSPVPQITVSWSLDNGADTTLELIPRPTLIQEGIFISPPRRRMKNDSIVYVRRLNHQSSGITSLSILVHIPSHHSSIITTVVAINTPTTVRAHPRLSRAVVVRHTPIH